MHIVSSGQTDVGLQREHNEDAYLIDPILGLYIVCDGVGGQAAGEVASQQTVRIVHEFLRSHRGTINAYLKTPTFEQRGEVLRLVESAIQEACHHLYIMAEEDPTKKGMGTTIAMLLALGDAAVIAHAGDSRVYLIRDQQAHQLTEDHSLAWELLRSGVIEQEHLESWPFSNIITRCVGSQPTVQVDTIFVECLTGDRFLICSDGLHGYLQSHEELVQLSTTLPPERLVESCIALANERGGKDNITIVVAQIDNVQPTMTDNLVPVNRKVEILKRIRLFQQCTYNELVKILNIVRIRSYKTGEIIVQEGSIGDEFFILLLGKVQVIKNQQELFTLIQGAPFGEAGLLEQMPRSATICAVEPTRVMIIRRQDLYSLLEQEPQMALKLFRSFLLLFSQRLRATNDALTETRGALTALTQEIRSLALPEDPGANTGAFSTP